MTVEKHEIISIGDMKREIEALRAEVARLRSVLANAVDMNTRLSRQAVELRSQLSEYLHGD